MFYFFIIGLYRSNTKVKFKKKMEKEEGLIKSSSCHIKQSTETWEKQSISMARHTEEISHWAQRVEKEPSSPWSWWEFGHWLSGDGFTPTLSKGNALLLSTPWQPPQKNSSLLHHDRCWLHPKPVLSSVTEFLARLCTCSCFICYSLMWGWHKARRIF